MEAVLYFVLSLVLPYYIYIFYLVFIRIVVRPINERFLELNPWQCKKNMV